MENLELTFRAENQCLDATNFTPPLFVASNTVDWIVAKFDLGTNWDCWDLGAVKAIWMFTKGRKYVAILDADGICKIPHEVLGAMTGEVKVNLVASTIEDGEVTERMTTYPLYCINVNKVAQIDGDNSVAITPSEYEQFVEDVQEYAQTAVSARDDALQAKDDAGDYALYAKDYSESAESYRDEAKGYAEDAEEASQSILELTAEASVDSSVGTPSVAVSVTTEDDHKVMAFDFHNLKGVQGETGATGADGFSPIVSVEETEDGHEVTITDAEGEHSFEVLNGNVENFYSFLPTDSASGSIASFPDGADNVPMSSLVAEIEPIQDLHGQDSPYPAGGSAQIWDEVWEKGKLIADGSISPNYNTISSTNYIPVTPDTQYYIKVPYSIGNYGVLVAWYDTDKNLISLDDKYSALQTSPNNAYYMRFSTQASYGTTYNHDIAINYPSTVTTYSPYSNICPISGRTEVTVVRSGVNQWDEEVELGTLSTTDGSEITTTNIIRTANYVPVIGGVSYYFVTRSGAGNGVWVLFFDANKNVITEGLPNYTSANNARRIDNGYTVTMPTSCAYIRWYFQTSYGTTYLNDTSLNLPSTATQYAPYLTPLTITTQLGQTVYGGTLDVVSGVLTVDRAMVDMGSLDWLYSAPIFYALINDAKPPAQGTQVGNIICSQYEAVSRSAMANSGEISLSTNKYINVIDSAYTDVASFKTAMNGVQLCCELATPITIQLTPTEVRTLLGTNNVWADSGDTEVTYKADIQRYIDKQISAVLNA